MAGRTVLVVEDDPVIVELLSINFEMEGFVVITAGDGEEGLARALNEVPDIVISDIMMPRMNGLELVSAMKVEPSTGAIPILLLSAKAQTADIERGLELGADGYVTKPFDPLELVERVNALIGSAKRR